MWIRRMIPAMILAGLVTFLVAIPVQAAGEAYGNWNRDWIWRAQDWLKHAAMNGPQWHVKRVKIERYIQDIGYLLQSASLAARTADYAVAQMDAQQAIRLLELGISKGYFRRTDVDPIVLIIKQQIPGWSDTMQKTHGLVVLQYPRFG